MWRSCLLVLLSALAAPGATFHVATTGDDAATGLDADHAWRTLQASVDRLAPGDTLRVHGGVYRETVTFHRSGAPYRPIVVTADDATPVTVSGCDPVADWRPYRDNIWQAAMPWTLGTGRNQVFAGPRVLSEARHPNTPAPGLGMYVSDLSPLWPTFGEFSLPAETKKTQPGRIVSKLLDGQPVDWWRGALYYGVHYEGWCAQTGVVESSKPGELTVGDRTKTWWFGPAYGGGYAHEEGRGMLVGHLHALDAPGEWHWQDNTLYLIPTTPGRPAAIEAKRRQLAFDLSGRSFITVRGLNVRGASLKLQDAANCMFERCSLEYISHFTRQYDIGQVEHGRDTIVSGETGVYVSGHDNAFLSCSVRYSAGAGFHLRGYHHTIHNCWIDQVSYTAHYLNAITDAVSDFPEWEHFLVGGHRITYNTLSNAGRHFFNFYGNGTSSVSRTRSGMDYMATLFAHNHLYNGMLLTKDAGFITGYYCSAGTLDGLNSQVAYNVMHDSYDLAAMRWGVLGIVYLDAGTCNVDLHHNLLWAAPGSLQRGLWYNTMCVDVHEHDNLFHRDFTRTSADLTAADFPGAQAFRFGHDPAAPPPLPEWPQLERQPLNVPPTLALADGATASLGTVDFGDGWQSAVMSCGSGVQALNRDRALRAAPRHRRATDPLILEVSNNDGLSDEVKRQWTFMYGVTDGAWIRFNRVPLGEGYRRFRVVYGNDQPTARRCEVRLDAPDGPLVGTVELPPTDKARGGHIQIYNAAVAELSPAANGTHDLCLVLRSPDGQPVGEFEYFRCEQYRGTLPLQPQEARLELRLDRADGPKIGECFPRFTDSPDVLRPLVTSLEPVTGRHTLWLAVRAQTPGEVGRLASVTLEKARQPIDWTGVGSPPREVDGRPVFPAPTNRPCARPADLFAQPRNLRPKPVAVAGGRALTLAEDPEGLPAGAPSSTATVSYDATALTITERHPVANGATLLPSSHVWGQVDGCEVALQAEPGPIHTLYGYPDGQFTSEDYGGATAAEIARLRAATRYTAAVGPGAWTCTWTIPFAALGCTPATAPLLRFNLGVRKGGAWVVWRGTGGPTYRVDNGGLLVFAEPLVAAGLPAKGLAVRLDAPDAQVEDGRVARWGQAVQPQAQFRPLLVANALGGRPAVRFDEARATRLLLPDLSAEKVSVSVFAVASNPVAASADNHDARIFTASDGQGFDYQIGIGCSIPGLETGGPRLLSWEFKNVWGKFVHVGCFSPNFQTFFTGDLGELVVYDRPLSDAERDRVRAYLTAKWGL